MKETVCVTGASGGIGQALLEQLVDVYSVKALFRTRTATSDKWARRGCEIVWGDLEGDEAALSQLVKDAKFVFHCGALVGQASYEKAYAVNVEGTRRMAVLAAAHQCQRFVHVSSVAVYGGASAGSDYVEDAELVERDDMAVYSLTKLQSEHALMEVAKEHGLVYTILRPTSVYGPNTKPHTLIPIELMRKGLPVVLGDGRGLIDAVYVEDVAAAMVLAATCSRAAGAVFNIGHDTVTFNDFYAHYSRMLNRPARRIPLPILTNIARLLHRLPGAGTTRRRELRKGVSLLVDMARNTKSYPSDKARASLGYRPGFNLSTGMLKTELWLKRQAIIPSSGYSLDDYGPLPFLPLAAAHPTTESEIVHIVTIAAQSGVRVRAIGSLHSTCPVPYTDGICVVMDQYNQLVDVRGPLVSVQGGMKLHELNETLAGLRLALPINGSITAQTVSGAISTGTHGGSLSYGSLSDTVEALRIVRADGSIVDIDRSHELFPAAVVSCGLLGIISTVTFRCVSAFALQSSHTVHQASEVLARFDEMNRRTPYTCIFYFPVTDQMEVLAIEKLPDGAANGLPAERLPPAGKPDSPGGRRLRQSVARTSLRGVAWLALRSRVIQRRLTKFSVGSAYQPRTGRSDRVLAMSDVGTSGRAPTLLQDMEIAVPYEQAAAAIRVLRDHFRTTRKYPLLPIHLRCSTRSDLWLSPAYRRDVCFFEFWQFPPFEDFFTQIHGLMEPFRYRFHWGKATRADRRYIERQYERWDDFVQLRKLWDPHGMFLNGYLQSFFCEETPPAGGSRPESEVATRETVGEE